MITHRYVGPEFPLLTTIPPFSEWQILDLEVPHLDYSISLSEGSTLF